MQSVKEFTQTINKVVLEEFICPECEQKVKRTELTIPRGPRKGEKVTADYGCNCKNKELGDIEGERKLKLRLEKMLKHFDGHSLLNKSLVNATFESYEPT
ncbi:hypothetical protein DES48_1301, partial [Paraliobacillus ryukyuensis]